MEMNTVLQAISTVGFPIVSKELVIKAYGEPCGIYFEAFEIDKQGNRIIEEVSE